MVKAFGKTLTETKREGVTHPLAEMWQSTSARLAAENPHIPKSPPEQLQIMTCYVILNKLIQAGAQDPTQKYYATMVRALPGF